MADTYVEVVLKNWKLAYLIPIFREQGIDEAAFKQLDDETISRLIPNKIIQNLFNSNYNNLKLRYPQRSSLKPKNAVEEIDDTNEEMVDDEQPSLGIQSSSFDIEFILSESAIGRQIIKVYDSRHHLELEASLSMVHILINFLITQSDDFSIEDEVLNEVADAIVARFPNEKKELYFKKVGGVSKGRLIDSYHSVRRNFASDSLLKRRLLEPPITAIDNNTSVLSEPVIPSAEWVDSAPVLEEQLLNVKWKSHKERLIEGLPQLRASEKFVDATIICQGQAIRCHKIVLCSYSSYFETMLSASPCKHPVIFLADLEIWEIQALVDFMYTGELNIEEHKLSRIFHIATKLNIEGLANADLNENDVNDNSETDEADEVHFMDDKLEDPLVESFSSPNHNYKSPPRVATTKTLMDPIPHSQSAFKSKRRKKRHVEKPDPEFAEFDALDCDPPILSLNPDQVTKTYKNAKYKNAKINNDNNDSEIMVLDALDCDPPILSLNPDQVTKTNKNAKINNDNDESEIMVLDDHDEDNQRNSPLLSNALKLAPKHKREGTKVKPMPKHEMQRKPAKFVTSNKKFHYKRCKLCVINGNRKDTSYFCSDCETYLCKEPCFKEFHDLWSVVSNTGNSSTKC